MKDFRSRVSFTQELENLERTFLSFLPGLFMSNHQILDTSSYDFYRKETFFQAKSLWENLTRGLLNKKFKKAGQNYLIFSEVYFNTKVAPQIEEFYQDFIKKQLLDEGPEDYLIDISCTLYSDRNSSPPGVSKYLLDMDYQIAERIQYSIMTKSSETLYRPSSHNAFKKYELFTIKENWDDVMAFLWRLEKNVKNSSKDRQIKTEHCWHFFVLPELENQWIQNIKTRHPVTWVQILNPVRTMTQLWNGIEKDRRALAKTLSNSLNL